MNKLVKRFVMKSGQFDGNTIKGTAAVMGNLDRGNDVIFPGAFAAALDGFLKDGFVATNHDWTWEAMTAMPKIAREEGSGLYCESIFHGTPDAQAIRQKCEERIDNGLSIGLSIGFALDQDSCVAFRSGAALLQYAVSKGYDLALFDQAGIRACAGACRGIVAIPELFEYSIVAVPMNPRATATDVKDAKEVARAEVKGQYLGDFIEPRMTLDVLQTLNDAVFYRAADVLLDWDGDTSTADKLDQLAGIFGEFTEIALRVLGAMLESQETAQAGADEIRTLWMDPKERKALAAGKSVEVKAGQEISSSNHKELTGIHEQISGACEDMKRFLVAKDPDGDATTMGAAVDAAARQILVLRLKAIGHRADLSMIALH